MAYLSKFYINLAIVVFIFTHFFVFFATFPINRLFSNQYMPICVFMLR